MIDIIEQTYAWNGNLTQRTLPTDYIILHHAAAVECTAQTIHGWHIAQGWVGIGYHYFVAKTGAIYRGRPYTTIGAHTEGYNDKSVGICAEGNFMVESMPDAQRLAIIALCKELLEMYPKAKIVGHRDCNPTACPGTNYPLADIQRGALALEPQPSTWARDAWAKGTAKGVIDGTRPQDPTTREELVVILARLGLL